MIASFEKVNRAIAIESGCHASAAKFMTPFGHMNRGCGERRVPQKPMDHLVRSKQGYLTVSSVSAGATRPANAENLFVAILAGAAALEVIYAFSCGIGLVGDWPLFRAGIERLLG